ncbi:MAG TPA: HDOD domain-containing protein [Gammaproteobacteria bacterium]|nr:HDOD domain-containing protein [Gammaproteobacteria bacterium]
MNRALKVWIGRYLEDRRLPALQGSVVDLDELYRQDDPFEQLSEFILRDPGVASFLLSTANGVHHQHFGMPVTTVEHAAMMLGLNRMETIHRQLPVIDPEHCSEQEKMLVKIYSRAWHASCQAMIWSRLRVDMVPGEVSLATLLRGVGEMAVWAFQPDKAAEVEEELIHDEGERIREGAQKRVLGFSYDALSAALAREWKLPLLVHESLDPENSSRPRIRIILLALRVARLAERGWYSPQMNSAIEEVAGVLHMSRAEMTSIVHRAAVSAARAHRTFAVVPAAARLLFEPAPAPVHDSARSTGTTRSAVTAPERCREQAGLTPKLEIYRQSRERLEQIEDLQPTVPTIVRQALRGIHEGIGMHRAVYASCAPDGESLKVRAVHGCEGGTGFGPPHLVLQPPNLFTRMMEKPTSIWINDANRAKLRYLLPASLLELLGCDSFFARSIFIDGRPEGLFYCDCHQAPELLSEERYRMFCELCDSAADAIKRLTLAHSPPMHQTQETGLDGTA